MTDNAQRNKAIVREFLTKTFTDRDFTAVAGNPMISRLGLAWLPVG